MGQTAYPSSCRKYGYPSVTSRHSSRASSSYRTPESPAGSVRARRASSGPRWSIFGNLNSRSAYDFASPSSPAICGSPAATMVIGSFFCTVLCSAVINPSNCAWVRNWTSSTRKTTPVSSSFAASPSATSMSVRSMVRSPLSASPRAASVFRPAVRAPSGSIVIVKLRRTAMALLARSRHRSGGLIRSNAWRMPCARRRRKSLSSSLETSISMACHLAAVVLAPKSASSTVLPTPRSPVMIIDCSVRPTRRRPSSTSNDVSWSSRPTSASGRAPAFGVYGFVIGSTGSIVEVRTVYSLELNRTKLCYDRSAIQLDVPACRGFRGSTGSDQVASGRCEPARRDPSAQSSGRGLLQGAAPGAIVEIYRVSRHTIYLDPDQPQGVGAPALGEKVTSTNVGAGRGGGFGPHTQGGPAPRRGATLLGGR